ncbi:hypothetical protein CI238_12616 [Colletotrichum incanum]|uniref:F-box domain-containing protein n=1 Tax=Colletotrichum incanum TaxID=1573173 RepID=A0A161Y5W5_COLIC|nr:hypothetical protein CI238_12616 [Colletotrichum incanum]
MAAYRLVGLPTEIVALLATNLPSQDLQNLRQTCKPMAEKTAMAFHDRFFATRYVMLERHSLLNLVTISHHPTLSKAVRTVELCVDHLILPSDYLSREELKTFGIIDEYDIVRQHDGEPIAVGDDGWEATHTIYEDGWKDQVDLFKTLRHIQYLTDVFSHLPNCKSVGLRDKTRPWGAMRLSRKTGSFANRFITRVLPNSMVHGVTLIRTLLVALLKSRLPVEELYVDFGHLMLGCTSVIPRMLALPAAAANAFKKQLTTITTFWIMVNPKQSENDFPAEACKMLPLGDIACEPDRGWVSDFLGFLRLFPALSNLTISFNYGEDQQQFSELSARLTIPDLRSLRLENLECTKDELMGLLLRHKETLRTVELDCVGLNGGSPDAWSYMVQEIRQACRLEKLDLSMCRVDEREFPFRFQIPERLYAERDDDWGGMIAKLRASEVDSEGCSLSKD